MSAEATNAVTSLVTNKLKRTAILAAGLFGLAVIGYFIKCASRTVTPVKCSCCPCTTGKSPVVGYCRNCRLACCQLCSWYDNHKEQYQHIICPLELPICCHCMEACCDVCSTLDSYGEDYRHHICHE